MTKSAQLEADIAESLRAKAWQEQIEREHRALLARRMKQAGRPSKLYEEHQADLAAGIFHGERRGRSRQFRRPLTARQAEDLAERYFGTKVPGAIGRARRGRKSPRFTIGYVVPGERPITAGTSDVDWESALVNAGVLS